MIYIGAKHQRDELGDMLDNINMKIWKSENGETPLDSAKLKELKKRRDKIERVMAKGRGVI